jgi:hypothetical protein
LLCFSHTAQLAGKERDDGLPIKASASWVLGGGDSDGDRSSVKTGLAAHPIQGAAFYLR